VISGCIFYKIYHRAKSLLQNSENPKRKVSFVLILRICAYVTHLLGLFTENNLVYVQSFSYVRFAIRGPLSAELLLLEISV